MKDKNREVLKAYLPTLASVFKLHVQTSSFTGNVLTIRYVDGIIEQVEMAHELNADLTRLMVCFTADYVRYHSKGPSIELLTGTLEALKAMMFRSGSTASPSELHKQFDRELTYYKNRDVFTFINDKEKM